MKTAYQIEIIDKLRKLRIKNNYTQRDLGSIIGMSDGQIGNIESPKMPHKYTLEQIKKICDALNYPIVSIFCDNPDIDELISNIIKYDKRTR